MSDLVTAARVAALAADDDPTQKQRVESIMERVKRIEESVALLMKDNVKDVSLPPSAATPTDAAVTAAATVATPGTDPDAKRAGIGDINNFVELKQAAMTVDSAPDPAAARAYIKRRARELNAENAVPAEW